MTFLFLALLLQSQIVLPGRPALENPAALNPVPKQLKKDYDKLWKRFLSGKDDAKVIKDSEKLLKKNADVVPLLILEAYVDFYAGREADAERKLQTVLSRRPADPIALYYLAELAYARGDFVDATRLYARLRDADPAASGIDIKKQRALLLAMETLLQNARRAAAENRLADAERFYRQALGFAPTEPALRQQLAEVLSVQGKTEEAAQLLGGLKTPQSPDAGSEATAATPAPEASLVDLGRWGNQINHFREIQGAVAITREEFAALLARYFPQLTEFGQTSQVLTDMEGSWAESAIRTVVAAGILEPMPNHTFQPARTVNRGEFAEAISRLTRVLGLSAGNGPSISPQDVVPNSTLYRELQPVLGYKLLSLDNAGNFNASAPVGGEEAVSIAEKLLHLIDKKPV